MRVSRRNFIRQSGLALTFTVAGRTLLLTPREAYARSVPFSVLNQEEVGALEALCERLLPGARENGVAHFVDSQLSLDPNDSLLFIKSFNIEPPCSDFYRSALAELNRYSDMVYGNGITGLSRTDAVTLIESLRDGNVPGWDGPPPPLVYHFLRNDAVDVVYGTMEGFADLGIPYLAHIEPPRAPYPLPPLPVFEHGEILARGFTDLDLRTSPIPVAILSREYKGRPACIYDSWCDAGCPTGAPANPLVEYLPRAVKAGAVMQADSYVTRVLTDRKGMKATGVEYYDKAGERHEQPADAVVIAAFTVENFRILLNSATDTHAGGLGNSSGTLGRYLMSHPAVSVFGMFKEETRCYYGVSGGQLFSQDGFEKEKSGDIFGSRQWVIGLGAKPNDLLGIAMSRADLFGNDDRRRGSITDKRK